MATRGLTHATKTTAPPNHDSLPRWLDTATFCPRELSAAFTHFLQKGSSPGGDLLQLPPPSTSPHSYLPFHLHASGSPHAFLASLTPSPSPSLHGADDSPVPQCPNMSCVCTHRLLASALCGPSDCPAAFSDTPLLTLPTFPKGLPLAPHCSPAQPRPQQPSQAIASSGHQTFAFFNTHLRLSNSAPWCTGSRNVYIHPRT